MHYQQLLKIPTTGKSLCKITSKVEAIVAESGWKPGLYPLRHTSASLLIQENADPDVLKDLANFMAKGAGVCSIHSQCQGWMMPAHIRTALTHTSEQIPIAQGQLVLGTWQESTFGNTGSSHLREIVHIVGK